MDVIGATDLERVLATALANGYHNMVLDLTEVRTHRQCGDARASGRRRQEPGRRR
jgi:hypothetical protein